VWALAQDSTGFLWVGAVGGLFRYDGRGFRRWAPDSIRTWVGSVTVSPDGEIVVSTVKPALYRVTEAGVERLEPPAGGWRRIGVSTVFDRSGRLWAVDGRVHSLDSPDGRWTTLPSGALAGESPRRVRADAGSNGALVLTTGGVWQVADDGTTRRLWSGPDVVDVAPDGRGGLLILQADGRVVTVRHGVARQILSSRATPRARAIAVTERSGTVWVSLDRYLVSLRPGARPKVLGPADGLESGGPLLVDREGSLWLGTFESLVQYPEPRTRRWSDRQGLPSAHVRFLARSGPDVAVVTWQGLGFLRPEGSHWRASTSTLSTGSDPCPLGDGSVLVSLGGRLARLHGTRVVQRLGRERVGLVDCAPASDGGRWLSTSAGLFHLGASGSGAREAGDGALSAAPVRRPGPPTGGKPPNKVATDPSGRLWVSGGGRVCVAGERPVLRDTDPTWSCTELPREMGELSGLVALPDGSVWASSSRDGLMRLADGHWEPVPGSARLPTRSVMGLVPSRSGDVWVLGHGFTWRVRPRPDLSPGWKVLERLTGWDGLASNGSGDLLEDGHGGVWLATAEGVIHVPAAVRRTRPRPPPVVLVEARADGRFVPLGGTVTLPHGHNRLELHFAALSFRDPARLRYEVRLAPRDSWETVRGAPSFRWLGLRPGTYRAQVRASLDGEHWSGSAAGLGFRVNPPWYGQGWAIGLAVAVLLLVLWAAYRTRVAYLLGLERQRTRIAMDLHDEVGSGLASVGILSGVLAAEDLGAAEARTAAGEIARTAEELGDSLSDIVWSLQPGEVGLEELATRLVEQGGRLFADGETGFRAELPGIYPETSLPLPLLRTVLLVGLEALHNAARHAGALEVVLGLRRCEGSWVLDVRDDGIGLEGRRAGTWDRATGSSGSVRSGRGGGHGLPGMRRRAREVGASLEIASSPGEGTTVRLRFAVSSRPWGGSGRRGRLVRWLTGAVSRRLA